MNESLRLTTDLGELRVLAGSLGLPQDLWSHLSPEDEARRLSEYCETILDQIEARGMTLSQYLDVAVPSRTIADPTVVRLPDPPRVARSLSGVHRRTLRPK